ncbi:hypothetical protein COLO4_35170 [Corchorus olitorius]|uniref:non-specific serine/threonine protein kinase n=1 Tax=Corchorus olitorius TaxID=93759 RepID=A0A1R3GHZ3_9ROSI|nr:hypothetical protein COLO4_35170 [Corchorus olitorius]
MEEVNGKTGVDETRTMTPTTKATARSSNQSLWLPTGVLPRASRRLMKRRFVWHPFWPPSLTKHIKALLYKRLLCKPKPKVLDKCFGYGKDFGAKYELGKELGTGSIGQTFSARGKKGELKDQPVAVKIISKAQMEEEFWIEDVRREVKILKALSGHKHFVKFYDACEDDDNVYIVMELCEGGDLSHLRDRIFAREGKFTEEEAKAIVAQISSAVSFCHLQGIVHRDIKLQNILFTSGGEDAEVKLIDFGISDFVRPGEILSRICGTVLFLAPDVLGECYGVEADAWSIGVITYYLLSGRWPFVAPTRSGIFQLVEESDPSFDDLPWQSISPEAKDFVKRLLNKDGFQRMTAAEALAHPWLRDEIRHPIPLDILMYSLVRISLRRRKLLKCAAQKALSKAITEDQLVYLRAQFRLLEPNTRDGSVSLENFKMALSRNATDLMDEIWVPDTLTAMESLANRNMYFEEFCAAAIHIHRLEGLEGWEQIVSTAFEHFERDGNRVISDQEFYRELKIRGPEALSFAQDCIRNSDGKLNLIGFTQLLRGRPKLPKN